MAPMELAEEIPRLVIVDHTGGLVYRTLAPLDTRAAGSVISNDAAERVRAQVCVIAGTRDQVCASLRTLRQPDDQRVLVALTELLDESASEFYELGAHDVFELPWGLDDLLRKTRLFLRWARRREQPHTEPRHPAPSEVRDGDHGLLRLVLDRSQAFLCITDAEGTIVRAEGAVLTRAGRSAKELVGASLVELYPGKRAVVESVFCAVDGAAVELQTRVGDRAFDTFFAPREGASGVVCVGFDSSRKAQVEAALSRAQRLEAMGFFAAGLAHDFKNLLTVISSAAKLVLDSGQVSGETREDVCDIVDASQRAEATTRQLMAFGRIGVSESVDVDADAVVRSLSRVFQRSVGRGIRVEVRCAERLPTLTVDRTQLDQVLLNLLVNARDAMPRGGTIIIEASARSLDMRPGMKPGVYVAIAVRDTGVGIEEPALARIFEPFFTTKPTGEGHGLGLATSFNFISQAGGTIEVASVIGVGTTFTVLLPSRARRAQFPAPSETGVYLRGDDGELPSCADDATRVVV